MFFSTLIIARIVTTIIHPYTVLKIKNPTHILINSDVIREEGQCFGGCGGQGDVTVVKKLKNAVIGVKKGDIGLKGSDHLSSWRGWSYGFFYCPKKFKRLLSIGVVVCRGTHIHVLYIHITVHSG